MTTLKTASPKMASLATKHLDVRLRKIRSLKTSALKPLKIVAAAKIPKPRPSIKSVVPYGLVIAALMLSGVTASEAHAVAAHAKTARSAHAVTHVVRRAVPAQQVDPLAQFFQGLFGASPVVRTAHSRAGQGQTEEGGYDPSEWSSLDASPPVDNSAQQAADQASAMAAMEEQQASDEMNATIAAAAAQAALDSQMTLQTEINANNGN
jgi:hypothetical protein